MIRAAALLRTLLATLTTGLDTGDQPASVADARTQPDRARIDSIAAFIRLGQLGTLAGLIQAVELLGTDPGGLPGSRAPASTVCRSDLFERPRPAPGGRLRGR